MTNFEKLHLITVDEFAEWLSNNIYDEGPWTRMFSEKYCNNCTTILQYNKYFNRDEEVSFCELNGKCKFFTELLDIPTIKDEIKLWLEADCNE